MPPRRKSQVGTAEIESATSAVLYDDDAGATTSVGAAPSAGEDVQSATTAATPSRPVSFATKQQKDAASGADGIDQYELARTQVTKVAKSAVPENVQLRKEVILGLIKSSTVFINYLSSAALDKTHEAGNKTISANHVISAFKEMGFPEEYASQLRREYNEKVKLEADRAKASKAAKADSALAGEQPSTDVDMDADESGAAVANEGGDRAVEDESIAVDLSKEGGEDDDDGNEDDDDEGADDEEEGEDGDREGAGVDDAEADGARNEGFNGGAEEERLPTEQTAPIA